MMWTGMVIIVFGLAESIFATIAGISGGMVILLGLIGWRDEQDAVQVEAPDV